ncbi:DUF5655 domain-containing protein [Ornithinimicrobium sp. W1679]|uniref:DUF5655 domain-containing protein n=1 Tax=unclassified Ornithinimicrobium TaxID=2615080 RepID=UPI003CED6989
MTSAGPGPEEPAPGAGGPATGDHRTPEDFFAGSPEGTAVFHEVHRAVQALGPVDVRVTRSQVAFRRRRGFAYLWRPGRYVRSDVPAVLSVVLPAHDPSGRWKEVAHPSPRVWMHHLEARSPDEVDDEVRAWLREAYGAAG